MSTQTGSTANTTDGMLRTLLRMTSGEATEMNLMRQLCGLVTGEFVSTCAQGKTGLQEFNRQLNLWFMQLGQTLSDFMQRMNGASGITGGFQWNGSSSSWSSMSGTGSSVKGWNWMNETDQEPLVSPMSSSAGRGQDEAWAACEGREGAGKSRCVREYLENQNMKDSGARS